jgi:DNA-binding CsgD family transcriptional regulator
VKQRKLSDSLRETLEKAALLGAEFSVPVLLSAGGSSDGLDRLFDDGWLAEAGPNRARFVQPTRSQKIAAAIPWSRKRKWHSELARACEALHQPPENIAHHCLAAREFEAARPMLVRAAEKACLQRRFREGLAFIRQALDIWSAEVDPDARLLILQEMARCAMNCREHSVARLAWEEIFEMASDPMRLVEAHRQLAELDLREGFFDEAGHHLEIAAELAERELAASEASRCWLAYADYLANRLLVRKAREAVASACRFAEKSENPALISEAIGYAGLVAAMCGRSSEASELVDRALRIALDRALPEQTALAYRRRANVCEYCADYVGETAAHLEAIRYCRRAGEKAGELSCLSCLAGAYFRTGEWKDASQTADAVLRDRKAHPAYQALARTVRAQLAAFRGEQRSAARLLDRNLIELRQLGLVGIDFQVLWARAFYFENEGRPEMAAATYDEIRLLWRESEDRHLALSGLLFAAAFYAENDRSRDTADCLDILNMIAQDNNNPESRATLRGVAAEAAQAEGDPGQAAHEFQEAIELFRKARLPLETAWLQWRLTSCTGEAATVRQAHREAMQIASRLGARPLLARLDSASAVQTTGLTRRQREVLDLLAAGLTDKETAARLNLSPRTVEMHVARLLESLNCRTRTEAVRKAGQRGWL